MEVRAYVCILGVLVMHVGVICFWRLIFPSLSRSAYPQAVRSLRSALNVQSRKENGIFVRREEECNIYFALRKVGQLHVCSGSCVWEGGMLECPPPSNKVLKEIAL